MVESVEEILEKEINEYYAMIDHFIQLGNKEEIKYWRRELQRAKIRRREVKNS